jgi:hypothetical protein
MFTVCPATLRRSLGPWVRRSSDKLRATIVLLVASSLSRIGHRTQLTVAPPRGQAAATVHNACPRFNMGTTQPDREAEAPPPRKEEEPSPPPTRSSSCRSATASQLRFRRSPTVGPVRLWSPQQDDSPLSGRPGEMVRTNIGLHRTRWNRRTSLRWAKTFEANAHDPSSRRRSFLKDQAQLVMDSPRFIAGDLGDRLLRRGHLSSTGRPASDSTDESPRQPHRSLGRTPVASCQALPRDLASHEGVKPEPAVSPAR